ncbi:MAG: VWA domain-containing protein [Burkholderiaceae bacterium]
MADFASLDWQWPLALTLLIVPLAVLVFGWKRQQAHLPLLVLVLGMTVLVLALTRPSAQTWMPAPVDRLIIVIDSSGSMRADDVQPSRIEVARQSARRLIDAMPASASTALVGLSAHASLLQAATRDREALAAALGRLALQPGSALGSGLAVGLAEALPEAKIDVEALVTGVSRRNSIPGARREPFERPDPPVEPGSRRDAIMVVLADGDSNVGADPRKVAEIAQLWGLRIYTVGIGTTQGVVLRSEGVSARVRLEEKTLRDLAQITGGEYFAISDQDALTRVYRSLSGRIGLKKKGQTEISGWVAALGMLLIVGSALISTSRTGRIFQA